MNADEECLNKFCCFKLKKCIAFTSRITEGTFSNAKIGEVLASDADLGFNSEVVFSLSDPSRRRGSERSRSPIKINPLDGTVYVNGTLNREKTPQIDLTIIAGIMASSFYVNFI